LLKIFLTISSIAALEGAHIKIFSGGDKFYLIILKIPLQTNIYERISVFTIRIWMNFIFSGKFISKVFIIIIIKPWSF